MDTVSQEPTPDATLIAPEKRKRGRPRKDPSEKRAQKAHSQSPSLVQLTKKANRVDPINDPNETMVGQIVTGVVEATFDAGYLLAVRIGNSKITLRGAVFKPGQTAPVTPENDVAPDVEMIQRTEIPFPTELQPKRRRKRRSKEKNMQIVTYVGNGSDPAVPPVGARGTTVNLSNGLSINQPAPHLRVHSVLPLAVCPPNGSTSQPSVSGNENVSFKNCEGGKPNDLVVKTESDGGDMSEPLFVEPLQTRHLVQQFQPPPGLGGVMHGGPTGRMTELLQAVQQNMGDDQIPRNSGNPTTSYDESGQPGKM